MKIYPHGSWQELAPGLWQITAEHSLPITRNMVVLRLPDGGLVLHSVIALEESAMKELESFGEPRIMLVPHAKHSMDAPFYAQRYPDLRVAAPAQSKAEIEKRRKVEVHGTPGGLLRDTPIREFPVQGMYFDESVFISPEHGCVVVNDVLANEGREADTFAGRLFKATGVPGGGFGVSRAARLASRDRQTFAGSLRELAELARDATVLTVSHGAPLNGGIPEKVVAAADRLA